MEAATPRGRLIFSSLPPDSQPDLDCSPAFPTTEAEMKGLAGAQKSGLLREGNIAEWGNKRSTSGVSYTDGRTCSPGKSRAAKS